MARARLPCRDGVRGLTVGGLLRDAVLVKSAIQRRHMGEGDSHHRAG